MDKTSAQRIVRETFKASFDRKRFRDFISELCNGFNESKALSSMGVPYAFSDHIKSCQRLGTFESADGELADVLIVYLTESFKLERTRTALRDFVAHKLKRDESYKEAGLVAFVAPDSKSWRFSYVRMEYETKRDPKTGKIKAEGRLTPARRHSYLVGLNEECHTAQSRFLALLQNTTDTPKLAQIETAFSVESVSKEFFAEYVRLFEATETALVALVEKDKTLRADFETKHINTADFTKKLLGQIVFLYFIQKKGWLGVPKGGQWGDGPHNFLRQLATQAVENKQNLFSDVLEPLFYDTLATDRGHEAWCEPFQCRIPFLNGGLFEPLAGYDWQHNAITLSNSLLTNRETNKAGDIGTGILDVFDRFNFTAMEDEPLEKEVAIDPEMLGKVFENLIEENRRKGLGAFYTPREIVHYMCQESLINYLDTALNHPMKPIGMVTPEPEQTQPLFFDSDEVLGKNVVQQEFLETANYNLLPRDELAEWIGQSDQFAHYAAAIAAGTKGDHYPKPPASIRKYAREIDELLRDITVCDPAVGSGAFLVGMMNEIVRARMALTPYFNDVAERSAYHFKRRAIQYSLYGVDIDAGAVEIAKLRLWLSLVVDEEDVQQIKPLPNLDYKIVVGNSLIGVEKNLFNQELFKRLEELKPKFFNESDRKKKAQFKKQIDALIHELTNGREIFDYEIYFSEVFHAKQGFDVVIANPPYVGEKGNKDIFRPIAVCPLGKRFYAGKMDLFYFFFHLALDLLKENGCFATITTNYYITATGGRLLRNDLKTRSIIKNLINFNELHIFESALGQHNMISIIQKASNPTAISNISITAKKGYADSKKLSGIVGGLDNDTCYLKMTQHSLYEGSENYISLRGASSSNSVDPMQRIFAKMQQSQVQLGQAFNVNQGIVSSADKVSPKHIKKYKIKANIGEGIFVLSPDQVNQLRLNSAESKVLKPWFKNSDIKKWTTSINADEFVIFADKRLNNLNHAPKLMNHLQRFISILNDSSSNSPYLHRPRSIDFDGAKIIAPQRSKTNTFAYNEISWFASADVYFVTDKSSDKNRLKYLLSLLNSKLYFQWFYHKGKRKGEMLELYQKPLSEIPIKVISPLEQKPFIALVDKILAAKQRDAEADTSALEREIDALVYALYDLTPDEIAIIEAAH